MYLSIGRITHPASFTPLAASSFDSKKRFDLAKFDLSFFAGYMVDLNGVRKAKEREIPWQFDPYPVKGMCCF